MNRAHACVAGVLCVAAGAVAAPPEYHDAVQAANPALWYTLEETSGNALNHGSLGSAFDAALFGGVTRGVQTSGGDLGIGLTGGAYLESLGTSTLTGNPAFSIEVVVNLASSGAASLWGPFLHWGDGGANRTGKEVYFGIQANDNRRIYAGFYNAGLRTPGHVPGNRWLHIVWTRAAGGTSESGSTLYVNGYQVPVERDTSLVPGFLTSGQINVTASKYRIGTARDFTRYFTGGLDELALYTRVLTAPEIAQRAAMVACRADYDGSGFVDTDDFTAYVLAFEDGVDEADFDGSGFVDTDDFTEFVLAFEAGC